MIFKKKKFIKVADKGWLGISDKYWITSLIPPKDKRFKTTFDYKKKFRANFIATDPLELNPNDAIEPLVTVILTTAPEEVPWLEPSPNTAA